MSEFRVGPYASLVEDMGYVIQKKRWWGWKTYYRYWDKEDARYKAKELENKGHEVHWYI